jgi:hypothetical protein
MLWSQFSRFLPIFGEKWAFFSKTMNAMIKFLQELAVCSLSKTAIFCQLFGENILKIITSVPEMNMFAIKTWFFGNKKVVHRSVAFFQRTTGQNNWGYIHRFQQMFTQCGWQARVTRWACEKNRLNGSQTRFLSKLTHNLYLKKVAQKMWATSVI